MTKMTKKKDFSKIFKKIASTRGIRQNELALILNISQSAISQIFNGKTLPSPKVFRGLKRLLMPDVNDVNLLDKLYTEIKIGGDFGVFNEDEVVTTLNDEIDKVDLTFNSSLNIDEDDYPQYFQNEDYIENNYLNENNSSCFKQLVFDLILRNSTLFQLNNFHFVKQEVNYNKDIANYPVLRLETDYYSPYIPIGTCIFLREKSEIKNLKKNDHVIVKFYNDNNVMIKLAVLEENIVYLKDLKTSEKHLCNDNIEWIVIINSYHFCRKKKIFLR